jgi:hypothetical protein
MSVNRFTHSRPSPTPNSSVTEAEAGRQLGNDLFGVISLGLGEI